MFWLLMFLLDAAADVPPLLGHKNVDFEISVKGAPEEGDRMLVVYPWSLSNGTPTAEVGVVLPSVNLRFGRRTDGEPAFWLVPSDQLAELIRLEESELRAWFEGEAAMKCEGDTPRPIFEVPVTVPDTLVQGFELEIEPGHGCTVRLTDTPLAMRLTEPSAGCRCATVGALGWAGTLSLLGVLGLRRRRD